MIKKKITFRFLFGTIQALTAIFAIFLALFLEFDLFGIQSLSNIPDAGLSFYVSILLILGLIFLIGGIFLVYDWWQSVF